MIYTALPCARVDNVCLRTRWGVCKLIEPVTHFDRHFNGTEPNVLVRASSTDTDRIVALVAFSVTKRRHPTPRGRPVSPRCRARSAPPTRPRAIARGLLGTSTTPQVNNQGLITITISDPPDILSSEACEGYTISRINPLQGPIGPTLVFN